MDTASPLTAPSYAGVAGPPPDRRLSGRWKVWWPLAAVAVVAVSGIIVWQSGIRPSYDGFGFMVWGRQVLHWNLNTDGAPSWKPLPFLFTLPYAVAGRAQMWLWMTTAVAGAIGGGVLAARVSYRLVRGDAPAWAAAVGGAFAGAGVLGIGTYSHLVLIANSDPLIVAVCLGAVDAHLSRRPRLAFAMLVLASLGRPEVWPFAGLYAVWCWVRVPRSRVVAVLGLALIPAFWFTIPALTSHSWFISGDLALNQATAIHGNKILGVFGRLRSLYELPMQVAVLCGVALAAVRRDRVALGVTAAALLWVVIEIGFAYHGWSAVARYMIEPAAVLVVVAGTAVARVLALSARLPLVLRWAGPVAVAGLIVALVPVARSRVHDTHVQIHKDRVAAVRINRLSAVIEREGGGRTIRSCGQPFSYVGLQSTLAWELGMNVGAVGFNPGHAVARGRPMVFFRPRKLGWRVRTYNLAPAKATSCGRLRLDADDG